MVGTICLYKITGQSAGNFHMYEKEKISIFDQNTNNKYHNLPKISDHIPNNKENLSSSKAAKFFTGLVESSGRFTEDKLHITFKVEEISLAYSVKKYIGYGKVFKVKDKNKNTINFEYTCEKSEGLF